MALTLCETAKVFVYQKPIDMRCGFERLSFFIKEDMCHELNFGDIFIFLGNNKKRLKALYFDGSGLVQLTKRMEKRRGFMSVYDLDGRDEITRSELELILHGSVLRKYNPEVKEVIHNVANKAQLNLKTESERINLKKEKDLPIGAVC